MSEIKSGKYYYDKKYIETEEFFKGRPVWMKNFDNDVASAAFIRGLIEDFKPEKLMEIGSAGGWAAAYMIEEAIKHKSNASLVSLDLSPILYYAPEKRVGSAFFEKHPNLIAYWDLVIGKYSLDYLKEQNKKFDFVFIDAAHTHPWATLDFIAVLPYLEDNAIVVFHDVFLNQICLRQKNGARHPMEVLPCRDIEKGPFILYHCFKDKMVLSYDHIATNAGAVCISKNDTDEILGRILSAITFEWEKSPVTDVDVTKNYGLLIDYVEFIRKHYGNTWAEKFMNAIYLNYYRVNH